MNPYNLPTTILNLTTVANVVRICKVKEKIYRTVHRVISLIGANREVFCNFIGKRETVSAREKEQGGTSLALYWHGRSQLIAALRVFERETSANSLL